MCVISGRMMGVLSGLPKLLHNSQRGTDGTALWDFPDNRLIFLDLIPPAGERFRKLEALHSVHRAWDFLPKQFLQGRTEDRAGNHPTKDESEETWGNKGIPLSGSTLSPIIITILRKNWLEGVCERGDGERLRLLKLTLISQLENQHDSFTTQIRTTHSLLLVWIGTMLRIGNGNEVKAPTILNLLAPSPNILVVKKLKRGIHLRFSRRSLMVPYALSLLSRNHNINIILKSIGCGNLMERNRSSGGREETKWSSYFHQTLDKKTWIEFKIQVEKLKPQCIIWHVKNEERWRIRIFLFLASFEEAYSIMRRAIPRMKCFRWATLDSNRLQ